MDDPTEPISLWRRRAEPCAACGRLVAWAGRDGFREVEGPGATLDNWPNGPRGCDRGTWWRAALVPRSWRGGHDPDPFAVSSLAPVVFVGLASAAVIVAAALLVLAAL